MVLPLIRELSGWWGGGQRCKENFSPLDIPLKLSKSVCMFISLLKIMEKNLKKKAHLRSTPTFHHSQAMSLRFQIP